MIADFVHGDNMHPAAESSLLANGAYFDAVVFADALELRPRRKKTVQPVGKEVGGRRGAITDFSLASRRRMMRLLSTIRLVDTVTMFVTLTCPDDFPDHETQLAYFEAFRRRLERLLPGAGAIWRVEYKRRKSGVNRDQVAPHWHLILVVPKHLVRDDLWQDIATDWHEIAGNGDPDHALHGCDIKPMQSRRKTYYYLSKYAGKTDDDGHGIQGRRWGVIGCLDTSPGTAIPLTLPEAVQLKRLVRRWLKSRGATDYAKRLAKMRPEWRLWVFGWGDKEKDLETASVTAWLKHILELEAT